MSIISLWYYVTGYLIISIHGRGREKLINLASRRGIRLWNIHWHGNYVEAKVLLSHFSNLEPLIEQTNTRVEILDHRGVPFLWRRLSRRQGLMAGIILFFITIYLLSSFVWVIEVEGTKRLDQAEIILFLEEKGLEQGALRRNVDTKSLERDLIINFDALCWATIEMKGTKVTVRVEENPVPPVEEIYQEQDLVASRDGLVERVLVLSGVAAVSPGDTVSKGDILIRGVEPDPEQVLPDPEETELPPEILQPVQARGEVWARTWYTEQVEVPLVIEKLVPTGEEYTRYSLTLGDRLIQLGAEPDYDAYRLTKIKWFADWRNNRLPVEFIEEHVQELRKVSFTRTAEQAYTTAKSLAVDRLKLQAGSGAQVVDRIERRLPSRDSVIVVITWEVAENIAVPEATKSETGLNDTGGMSGIDTGN